MDTESTNSLKADGRDARRDGLLGQIALRKFDNRKVHASSVTKAEGPFFCPSCLSDAVVRKCSEKIDHFAHNARKSPIIKRKDQMLHNKCRDIICSLLNDNFPDGKWETERPIKGNEEKKLKSIIPDISGRIGNVPVAIEVQASAYTINKIANKTIEYYKRGVAVLWVIPLFQEFGVEPFRPRLFEKYLHSMYFGRVYYWTEANEKLLLPIHYSPTTRWIEESSWYDVDAQEERAEGGFLLPYKTIKVPKFGDYVDITKSFQADNRQFFSPKNTKKAIPECIIFKDTQPNWWKKEEMLEIQKQAQTQVNSIGQDFASDYEYWDDYDDFTD